MTDITVLVVDDQPLMLHALRTFLDNEDGVVVVGTAEDGEAAIEQAHALKPDLVLMDLKMPRMNGIDATHKITDELPGTRVVALTTFSTLDYVVPALRAGASGYLVKDAQPEEILTAIKTAMDDNLPLSPGVVRLLARQVIGGATTRRSSPGRPRRRWAWLPARSPSCNSWDGDSATVRSPRRCTSPRAPSRPTWPTPV